MKLSRRCLLLIALLATLNSFAPVALSADLTSVWNNTTGDWSDSTRWSTNPIFPNNGNGGFTYDAVVDGGSVTLDQDITIEKFNLTTGTLTGASAFTLTLNDLFTWTGGFVRGPGIVQADGGMNISGVTKSFRGGRTLNNAGIANWTASNVNCGEGAIFNNQDGATFDTNFNGSFSQNLGGALTQFNNAGSFTKSGGVGTTSFSVGFNNTGAVNANSGTLSLSGGGSSSGVFAAGGDATLDFSGTTSTHNLNAGTAVSGAGTVQVSGGIWNFNAGTYNVTGATTVSGGVADFNATANSVALNLSGGTLGGTGNLTASGLLTWTGGIMNDAGTTQADGGMNISGVTKSFRGGRTLNNAGIANWTAAIVNCGEGAIFNNQAGATFDTNFDGSFSQTQGGALAQFNNAGSFTKSGGLGTTSFSVGFNNTGTVNANSGTLSLSGGGSSSGVFAAGGDATLDFSGTTSTHNLNAGTAVSGAGTVQVSGGIWNFNAGTYNVTGATTVSGGVADFNATANSVALNLSGGTLGGTGNLTASGLLTWTGGIMNDAGTTQADGGMNISGVTKSFRGGRTLNNAGIANWTAAIVNCGEGAIFNNQAGATFDTNFDGSFSQTQGGALAQFNNAGTFTKSGGVGTTNFSVGFNNTGAVNANSGTLSFTGGYTQTAGSLVLNGGAVSTNTTLNIQGGSVTGNGTITGNVVVGAATIAPGASAGEITIGGSGNLTLSSGSIFAVQLGGSTPGSQYDRLTIAGSASLDGTLDVSLINGFTPTGGQQFTILTASSIVDNDFVLTGSAASSFSLFVNSTSVILQAIGLAGDYNHDNTVDAADYVVWRKTDSGNSQGYSDWRENFGEGMGAGGGSVGPSPSQTGVPEPATLVLLMFAATGWSLRRSRFA